MSAGCQGRRGRENSNVRTKQRHSTPNPRRFVKHHKPTPCAIVERSHPPGIRRYPFTEQETARGRFAVSSHGERTFRARLPRS